MAHSLTMAEGFERASDTLAHIQERMIEMIDEQSYGDAMDTTEVFEVARDFHLIEDILRSGLKLHLLTLGQRESKMPIGEQIAYQEQQSTLPTLGEQLKADEEQRREAVKEETQTEPLIISNTSEWITIPLHEDHTNE
jgi:hypothetical protein